MWQSVLLFTIVRTAAPRRCLFVRADTRWHGETGFRLALIGRNVISDVRVDLLLAIYCGTTDDIDYVYAYCIRYCLSSDESVPQ